MIRKRPRRTPFLLTLLGLSGLLAAAFLDPAYRLVYNPSESAPLGWYLRVPARRLSVNDWVFTRLPEDVATFAAQRGYLPQIIPALKRIGAVADQFACGQDGALYLDGKLAAHARTLDGVGRPLAPWTGCRRLEADELLLLNPSSAGSFDSRYFGPLSRDAVLGRAIPLWTW